ncbi:anti-sigma factor family protein [Serinibacter salmoneus]|uniref:Putative zinc finger protein n=1 Tax=Serinibacter salmoneus TaxID=556530 RepID=A0A2A9CYR2_9MICO|nr:zf-HC2 domain-containing protein [Serinibacter salmoneus]PFG19145.1 putative zinc finger protein [Serinibacter salmoneus]
MITTIRELMRCHWTGRRIPRYLDHDPAAPLTPAEVERVEEHLEACGRCREAVRENRVLRLAMSRIPQRVPMDPGTLERMRRMVTDWAEGQEG